MSTHLRKKCETRAQNLDKCKAFWYNSKKAVREEAGELNSKFKKLFFRLVYLDFSGNCIKEDSYFFRFSKKIGQSNLLMMRSMSAFMLVIGLFVIASTFTYFGESNLRRVYIPIILFEIGMLVLLRCLVRKEFSARLSHTLTALHLFHMLAFAGYISIVYCRNETAILFMVVLTISSMIYTLPTLLSMSISAFCTAAVIVSSYFYKDAYWFESDTLNGISVLIFSIMFGWRINRIRMEEAFARADAMHLNEELTKISITDPLTGLNNHRSFQDCYYEMYRRASTLRLPFGVIMMDLDKFKAYNDNYGHVAGDDCLKRVAAAIAGATPNGAIACRYGGEEFVVLLNESICMETATVGEEIHHAVAALKIPHAYTELQTDVVTLSLGAYVGIPTQSDPPMSFVERADQAMYQSKAQGRNRLTVSFEDLDIHT